MGRERVNAGSDGINVGENVNMCQWVNPGSEGVSPGSEGL